MKISRLRLLGFKSFVEPTELVIEPGLTGVVGPNGCGKSNLLEALRWVMGETSHKSMRAAAMDDVIFAGTNNRPPRNMAEVTMFLDNAERLAPAEFNDSEVIEITRRIERDAGSAYRINGRDVRARDVKILFEDAATGARSPALVRQGQISEIVNAKPEQRRRVLEDAAGIAGLHSRRHEAELRLRAAEGNLARLNDILGALTSQIESLKRQARQARRYKEISTEIRKSEALLCHLSWADAQAQVDAEEKNLTDALTRLSMAAEAESQALRREAELAESVQPLRVTEAEKGAALGRIKIESESFERESQRAMERQRELAARAEQLEKDIARETSFIAEAREIVLRVKAEIEALAGDEDSAETAEKTARKGLETSEAERARAEAQLTEITNRVAEARAKRRSLETSRRERSEAVAKIERQLTALGTQTREVAGRAPDTIKLARTTELGQQLAAEIEEIEALTLEAESNVQTRAEAARQHREEAAATRLLLSVMQTERETLIKLLVPVRDDDVPPIVDLVTVAPGYETALGAALGDDLEAPASSDAPVHWRRLAAPPIDAQLPDGVMALSAFVDAPLELQRRLSQVGVVAREVGILLQPSLKPGQRLVSIEGDLWRWDGFVAIAGGATPAAQRLFERNRLDDIERREIETRSAAAALLADETAANIAHAAAETEERRLRQLWRETQTRMSQTRDALTLIERQARETETKLSAISEARAAAQDDLVEANERLAEVEAAISLFDEGEDLEPIVTAAQAKAAEARNHAAEARARLAALEGERQRRAERIAAANTERDRWTTRSNSAEQQVGSLESRRTEAVKELETLADLPALIKDKRQKILSALATAEEARRNAADALATAENNVRAAVQTLRAAHAAVSEERETKARTEARLEAARARRQDEARRIRETFQVAPENCLTLAGLSPGSSLPSLAEIDRQVQRLKGDRERLGGVNLQADEELTVLQAQATAMETERDDVDQAISKLRGAIVQLNKEGKKRLEEAFHTVNSHFQRLFTTLFGGGDARLEMIASEEDPLEGGLEIIAKPPGKKPATLSLLSGGEQTLTALSLIFAVFLTNPSPICVLDEVDAPLDDANVDRFCTLMERMAEETATRFLVITHHPMTMTRMNRLFGVTMGERGVSQLVSVDLETAQRFREAV